MGSRACMKLWIEGAVSWVYMARIMQNVERFLSVESLDGRLKPCSRDVKYQNKENDGDGSKLNGKVLTTQPSRWGTWEFRFYYLAFIVVLPLMLKAVMEASSELNPNYPRYAGMLSKGWIFGRKVDNSDSQYRFFRDNLPLLIALMLGHTVVKRVVRYATGASKLSFDFGFGLCFLYAAHGVNSVRILLHMLVMYSIAHLLKNERKLATVLSWTYGIGTLFINDKFRNYPFSNFISCLSFLDTGYKGIIHRWDVFFNFTLLRMLSYNMDFLERWSSIRQNQPSTSSADASTNDARISSDSFESSATSTVLNERQRLVAPHNIQDYGVINYIAYITYTPLLIAGPIVTFNDYVYQSRNTLPSINVRYITSYAIRFAICILTMEMVLHFAYVVAISKTKAWTGDTPFQISMIGLFNLNIIWLKLLIPWRLFRLWALIDGIDAPENMIRCVDNNYSALAFWRAWHRSYNKWVVRYIYIQLGGSKNRILSSLAVFSFVAIWHDIQLKLLLWGWLIVIFLLPELFATQFFARYRNRPWYRHLCAAGAVINIWMMMIANLFGFCLGSDGTMVFLRDLFGTLPGITFAVTASGALFIAVQIMFEQREHERRHGINLKC
ncbi:hypothetical protein HG536_0A01530 [Torulaspora globosa]|uniref:Glycerol uptake protein 1 n=1 Tax=Torulaspora globosa TaxID=48254 RepID=A0A7G3ZA00_9SACH|nr:uncharacterized protein HG536_0A01530 [Torulaspora globosa]QLL30336.1 hypothetical protein HG536_0A01530 [Torulaspora globosa]